MAARQFGVCGFEESGHCLTPGKLMQIFDMTFEHVNKRGAGKQDDRIVDEHGNPMNCAAHAICNQQVGSRRVL